MKEEIFDYKHLYMICIIIISIILTLFTFTYAFFQDNNSNSNVKLSSKNTFGEYTAHEPNVYITGNLTNTNKLKNDNTISYTAADAEAYDYLLTIAAQIDPKNTEYKDIEYTNITYEIYHKTDESIDTSTSECIESKYNNGTNEDYCNKGTLTENSLNGIPFENIKTALS